MTNDNQPPETNIVGFKKKPVMIGADIAASVFIKDEMVGLSIKDGLIFLPPESALQMCMVIASALKAILDDTGKGN
jgi:hypothetical protein